MNSHFVKMPLIRVAHPSQQECEQELNKVERYINNTKRSKNGQLILQDNDHVSLGVHDDNDIVTMHGQSLRKQIKDEIIAGAPSI